MKVPEPRKLKSGSYFIQLRLNGVSVPITAPTAKECKRTAELIKAEHRAEKREIQADSSLTLDQAITRYISARSNVLSPATVMGYESIHRNRFKRVMRTPLKSVKSWQTVVNEEASICGAKTLKSAWSLAASAMTEAGYAVPRVKLPQIVQKEKRWLTAEQIPVFIKAVHGRSVEIAALLGLHSLRRSEIIALTWDKIDLSAGVIRVEGSIVPNASGGMVYKETNKSRNSRRTVPIMIPELREALEAVEGKTGRVVAYHPNAIYKQVNSICKGAGLPEIGVHGLRHSFASLAHHVGLPAREAMLIGGWEDAQTMYKIYTHISEVDRVRAENKLSDFFKKANKNANNDKNALK